MKWTLNFLLLILFLFSGCGIRERETALQDKETELARREQELLLKEKELQLKIQELSEKEQQIGSVQPDSTQSYNPALVGTWTAQMVNTQTTCPGSAVGDTKTETWELSYQNGLVVAKAMTGENISRIYSGIFKNGLLVLTQTVESSPAAPATKMFVQLTLLNPTTMEGQREIIRAGDCKIIYDLKLNKK